LHQLTKEKLKNGQQFANVVAGEPQSNWQVKSGSLGFSRGRKGFFAMGDLNNVTFSTGLPDGEYCDVVDDCRRKIVVVDGGYGIFNKTKPDEPIVAICVGCS